MRDYIDITYNKGKMGIEKYRMYKGYPTQDIPKDWKKVGLIRGEELCNSYNSGLIELYTTGKGPLKYSTYRDGCFWPYTGTIRKI